MMQDMVAWESQRSVEDCNARAREAVSNLHRLYNQKQAALLAYVPAWLPRCCPGLPGAVPHGWCVAVGMSLLVRLCNRLHKQASYIRKTLVSRKEDRLLHHDVRQYAKKGLQQLRAAAKAQEDAAKAQEDVASEATKLKDMTPTVPRCVKCGCVLYVRVHVHVHVRVCLSPPKSVLVTPDSRRFHCVCPSP